MSRPRRYQARKKKGPKLGPGLPWSDESAIELENARIVNGDPKLLTHMEVVNASLTLLQAVLHHQPYKSDEDVTALRLGVRVLNSAAAALKLGTSGFYQPAVTMVRDVMEIAFLADLFTRDRTHLTAWITLPEKNRKQRFSPVAVRRALDELDGFQEEKRRKAYDLLCGYAAHVTPEGFRAISPDNLTRIGPFPSKEHVGAVIEELVQVLPSSCLSIASLFQLEPELLIRKAQLSLLLESWAARFLHKSSESL